MPIGRTRELVGSAMGTTQYLTPKRESVTLRIEGPTPQYHAQKATAGKRVKYGRYSPRNGLSAARMNKPATVAKNAITYGAKILLEIRAEAKLAVAIGPPPLGTHRTAIDFTKLTAVPTN